MKVTKLAAWLAAPSLLAIAAAAHAQTAPAPAASDDQVVEEIVVTSRFKSERAIDVPATVTGVTSADIQQRNVLNFADLNTVVPGLNLTQGGIGSDAGISLRGVQFDAGAQAANTVTAYVDEVPTSLFQLFNSLFDIERFEILRGPQGTLRGEPAPTGSIGLVTRRPSLTDFGGYASSTVTTPRGVNVQGAVSVPLIADRLAVRLAGAVDHTSGNNIKSVNNPADPFTEGKNFRATLLAQPADNVRATVIYRHDEYESQTYGSAVFGNGAAAASFPLMDLVPEVPGLLTIPALSVPAGFNGPRLGRGDDRAVTAFPSVLNQNTDSLTGQLSWSFAGQNLFYVGNKTWTSIDQQNGGDAGGTLLAPSRGYFAQDFKYTSHELRMSSEAPIGGFLDYVIGGTLTRANVSADFASDNVLALNGAFGSPLGVNAPRLIDPRYIIALDFTQRFKNKGGGLYANLKFHLGDKTELSLGGRQIWQDVSVASPSRTRDTYLAIPASGPCTGSASGTFLLGTYANAPLSASPYAGTCNVLLTQGNGLFSVSSFPLTKTSGTPFIWSAALSHKITPDLMVYASAGTSWRGGPAVVGAPSCDSCSKYQKLADEKSTGYEAGLKGKLFDRRLTFAAAAFYQDYTNYITQSDTVPYRGLCSGGTCTLGTGQFSYNAPIKSKGVDLEFDFRASEDLKLGGSFSYAKARFSNASVPCFDSNFDGKPDGGVAPTTDAGWVAAGGPASGPALCKTNGPVSSTPPWNLVLRGEYSHEAFEGTRAFLRGTVNYTPSNSNNVLANPGFVPKAYGVVDLFTGLTADNGAWEVSLAARNLLNTRTILGEQVSEGTFGLAPFNTYGLTTGYRGITRVPARTFQLSLRYAFGSR